MKINKILLYDNAYNDNNLNGFVDYIEFENYFEKSEIVKTINDFRDQDYNKYGYYTYSNEDIYKLLDEKYKIKELIYLSEYDRIGY